MPIGEALVTAQLHGHQSILYMMAMADKSELDKLIEEKDQSFSLYNSMEAENAQFARRREYEEKLNQMRIELNSRIDVEEKLMGKIKALTASEEEARARAEEHGKVREAIQKV
ncbi:uncharacterized protein LOC111406139 isoform X3 [Olea europaea var. sylvestris]|uniref:uncharacterized protein LOC111406139 isoform X3 n=1 Tax=Olea europaea var. sylvestris TaxID=158386 RepID=UPI000C1D6611|nr:uncharacterized protein LOC111406139 isoform X3 [Olea europaea var. sylvestris]XP_022891131.1 uncharacterized protein LOC111406139 isoform X3 [Olea europaea var. sylvestris]